MFAFLIDGTVYAICVILLILFSMFLIKSSKCTCRAQKGLLFARKPGEQKTCKPMKLDSLILHKGKVYGVSKEMSTKNKIQSILKEDVKSPQVQRTLQFYHPNSTSSLNALQNALVETEMIRRRLLALLSGTWSYDRKYLALKSA